VSEQVGGRAGRIAILDIVRGFAVLGLFAANVPDMALPEDLVLDFHASDPARGPDFWAALAGQILVSDKMRGLFTILFGVSTVLIVERLESRMDASAAARLYFRRLWWLAVIGLVHAYLLLWWAEVLFKYAILGLLLFPLRRAPFRALAAAMAVCLAVLVAVPFSAWHDMANLRDAAVAVEAREEVGQGLTESDRAILRDWADSVEDMYPDKEYMEEEIAAKTGSYEATLVFVAPLAFEEQTYFFLREDIWDMALYTMLGILLYRSGFFAGTLSRRMLAVLAIGGIAIGAAVHGWIGYGLVEARRDPVAYLFYLIFFDLGRLPFVIGIVSLALLLFTMPALARPAGWLAAAGRMVMTNYVLQAVLGALVFYGVGLALFNAFDRMHIIVFTVAVTAFQIVFSVWWMDRFRYGPLEWLWRSLTWWRPQPMKKGRRE